MSNDSFIRPVYYIPIERKSDRWRFLHGEIFWNPLNLPIPQTIEVLLWCFRTSMGEVIEHLRKINNAAEGYYLANILDKKYYYCGTEWDDIKTKLMDLGIGTQEPKIM